MISRRLLQAVVLLLSLIPLAFGGLGLAFGAGRLSAPEITAALDSQFRFMAGWYLALAMLCWWIMPRIERETAVFRIVCAAVFLGGVGRLLSIAAHGWPPAHMVAGLTLELAVPLLVWWQASVARNNAAHV